MAAEIDWSVEGFGWVMVTSARVVTKLLSVPIRSICPEGGMKPGLGGAI